MKAAKHDMQSCALCRREHELDPNLLREQFDNRRQGNKF